MSQTNWYAVQCKSRESFIAQRNLENQGFVVFHPTLAVEKNTARGLITSIEPLFPYYLFVQLNSVKDNWRPLRSTRGVAKLVTSGLEPLKVPDAVIEQLQSLQNQPVAKLFAAGDKVAITAGPFKGLQAIYKAQTSTERVVILLNLLQQQQEVQIEVSSLKKES